MAYKIDSDGATVGNEFTDGNPSLGVKATQVEDTWLNMVQGEIVNTVEAAGLTLDKNDNTQLLQALSLISTQNSQTDVRSASALRWDGSKVYFNDNIEIAYRSGSGARRVLRLTPASCPVPGEITIADGSVVVVAKDNDSASPVTLTYQAVYANLSAGEWAVVAASSLTDTNIAIEMLLFGRVDVTPTYHYGEAQKTLTVFPLGDKYFDESVFTLGSSENKLLQGIYSQAILNGNCEVSQFGNFTTAVNSVGGVSNNRNMIDGWKFGGFSASMATTNATFKRTTATITGEPRLKKACKIVMNTSGAPVSGFMSYGHVVGNSDYTNDMDLFKGRTVTFEFWLKSNKASNVRAYIEDGVNTTYHEINTGSGDETWRRYSVSLAVSASATSLKFWVWVGDSSGGNVSVADLEYIEVTGGRVHIGTERIGPLFLEYAEDLRRCRVRFYGARDGEKSFAAGYGIYNINGVASATWGGASIAELVAYSNNTDVGAQGFGAFNLPLEFIRTSALVPSVYLFDGAATTNGGPFGVNPKVSVVSAGAAQTNNVTADIAIGKAQVLVNNSTVITEGIIFGYLFAITNLT